MRFAKGVPRGCAGAMHESLRIALTMSPEYIWLFDDDVEALPDCLEIAGTTAVSFLP